MAEIYISKDSFATDNTTLITFGSPGVNANARGPSDVTAIASDVLHFQHTGDQVPGVGGAVQGPIVKIELPDVPDGSFDILRPETIFQISEHKLSTYNASMTQIAGSELASQFLANPSAYRVVLDGSDQDGLGLFGTNGQDFIIGYQTDDIWGYGGDDLVDAGDGDDTVHGGGGNDIIDGGGGNDALDGGDGLDSARFSGVRSTYTLTDLGGGSVRVSGPDGTDTLSSIDRLVFDDKTVIWSPVAVSISAAGDFNSNGMQDYIWRDSSAVMTMWEYDATAQKVTPADLGTVGFSWNILASDHFTNASTVQMLAQNVGDGNMSLWWVSNGQLVGVSIGQYWNGINYITNGQFTNNGGAGISNFLFTNAGDHHLYDWWIDSGNHLQGIDLGAAWNNVGYIASGKFTTNGGGNDNFLVFNAVDHHLYDWWIDPTSHTLQGIDLGAAWNNVGYIASGKFTTNGGGNDNFLVFNAVDHHLYDWWIDPTSHTLQGIDLGAAWNNVQFLASGRFDNNTTSDQFLVRNILDAHLYVWWITPQHTLAGIDLGAQPGIDLIDNRHFNNANGSTTNNEWLVRNTADGHFYEWWISNNQLAGADLGNAIAADVNHAPTITLVGGADVQAASKGQVFQASQLFTASDADNDTLTYALVDFTPGGGNFIVNGQPMTSSVMQLTAAQLAQASFQAGFSGTDHLRVGVNDTPGATLNSAGWVTQDFNVSAPVNQPTISLVGGADVQAASKGQVFQASQLFGASDIDTADTLTYALVDFTPGGGNFIVNGQPMTSSVMQLTAAQLAQASFQAGFSGTDHLRVGVNDTPGATLNSAGWVTQDFNVSAPVNHAPTISLVGGADVQAASKGQVFQASQLFGASDIDTADTLTYALVDFTPDANSGHFIVNGQPMTSSVMQLTAAQLAQASFQAGFSGTDHLRGGVNDTPGATLNSAGWVTQDFNVSGNQAPVISGGNASVTLNQVVDAASLFSVTDADNDPITAYQFTDANANPTSGHFGLGGVEQPANQLIDVSVAQLAQGIASFAGGSAASTDTLAVRASDGTAWSDWHVLTAASHA